MPHTSTQMSTGPNATEVMTYANMVVLSVMARIAASSVESALRAPIIARGRLGQCEPAHTQKYCTENPCRFWLNAGRVRRVRAQHDQGTSPCGPSAGQGCGDDAPAVAPSSERISRRFMLALI